MLAALGLLLAWAGPGDVIRLPEPEATPPPAARSWAPHRMDAPTPPRPAGTADALRAATQTQARELGTPTTLYVNFDGIELDECEPSNSKKNCHWYNNDKEFPPFSGTLQTQISVLQAMRKDVTDYGIRVTATRPPADEDYTMVIYGGTEAEYSALGSAPAGDCGDQLPNQIVFAHVDGELNTWINGGATTALHEAAHSWGLDHIDAERSIMLPAGNNAPVTFAHLCAAVVEDTQLTPGEAACPEVNAMFCDDPDQQDGPQILTHLFGSGYIDTQTPTVTLVEPGHGMYFQAPAEFDVVLQIEDDLHPQAYSMSAWIGGEDPPDRPQVLVEPGFSVTQLPIGEWDFHIVIADEAGNAAKVEFTVIVGEDPPPEPEEGCACRAGSRSGPRTGLATLGLLLVLGAARRRKTR